MVSDPPPPPVFQAHLNVAVRIQTPVQGTNPQESTMLSLTCPTST